jgi:serine protease AprX
MLDPNEHIDFTWCVYEEADELPDWPIEKDALQGRREALRLIASPSRLVGRDPARLVPAAERLSPHGGTATAHERRMARGARVRQNRSTEGRRERRVTRSRHRSLTVIAAAALVALTTVLPAGAAPAPRSPAAKDLSSPARALVDRDGDHISDGLGHMIAGAEQDHRFVVAATFVDRAALLAARARVLQHVDQTWILIAGFQAHLTAGQIRALAASPGVIRVEQSFTVHATMDAADRDFATEAARADFGATGAGAEVCVIDTGADPNHEQLDSKAPIPFNDLINHRTSAYDDNGHGTHVSSIAVGDGVGGAEAAKFGGVAPGATLSVAKVLDSTGSGPDGLSVTAIQWCVGTRHADVISMSLGANLPSDGLDVISQAVDAAVAAGTVVVAAAGNSYDAPGTITAPGSARGAITVGSAAEWSAPVGAPNRSEGPFLDFFSSRGPTIDGRIKPDIAAPGDTIMAANAGTTNGYTTHSGTSMATPFVSGTAALLIGLQPGWTPTQVRVAIEETAFDVGPAGKDNDWGAGLLDGYGAVARAAGRSGTAPFPTHQWISGSVGSSGSWTTSFTVVTSDLGAPIAATIILDGSAECVFDLGPLGCLSYNWNPDLDTQLLDPAGTIIAESTCPLGSECGYGRQETLHATPTLAGTYTIRVAPYGTTGGSFAIDLFHGPVTSSPPPPPPPPNSAHVGDLDDTSFLVTNGWKAQATIRINTEAEAPLSGAVVIARWPNATTMSCTTDANGVCRITRKFGTRKLSVLLTVVNVVPPTGTYAPADNHDPDGDSDGTTISLSRP